MKTSEISTAKFLCKQWKRSHNWKRWCQLSRMSRDPQLKMDMLALFLLVLLTNLIDLYNFNAILWYSPKSDTSDSKCNMCFDVLVIWGYRYSKPYIDKWLLKEVQLCFISLVWAMKTYRIVISSQISEDLVLVLPHGRHEVSITCLKLFERIRNSAVQCVQ